MGQKIIKWIVIGILAGLWVGLYGLADHGSDQAILIVFSIIGATYLCKCEPREGEQQHV